MRVAREWDALTLDGEPATIAGALQQLAPLAPEANYQPAGNLPEGAPDCLAPLLRAGLIDGKDVEEVVRLVRETLGELASPWALEEGEDVTGWGAEDADAFLN